jgi:hypothetical protein
LPSLTSNPPTIALTVEKSRNTRCLALSPGLLIQPVPRFWSPQLACLEFEANHFFALTSSQIGTDFPHGIRLVLPCLSFLLSSGVARPPSPDPPSKSARPAPAPHFFVALRKPSCLQSAPRRLAKAFSAWSVQIGSGEINKKDEMETWREIAMFQPGVPIGGASLGTRSRQRAAGFLDLPLRLSHETDL